MKQILALVFLIISIEAIDWRYTDTGSKWSNACNIRDSKDLLNVTLTRGEDCTGLCYTTCKCTHFVWSNGICWLKKGDLNETSQLYQVNDTSMICGISAKSGGNFIKCMKQSFESSFRNVFSKIQNVFN